MYYVPMTTTEHNFTEGDVATVTEDIRYAGSVQLHAGDRVRIATLPEGITGSRWDRLAVIGEDGRRHHGICTVVLERVA
jgi:hypothetical protein